MPARRKCGPSRWSSPTPSATLTTSAPVASQTFAISLMNEIRVIRNAFAASLIISAELTSERTIGASMRRVETGDRIAVLGVERADRDAVGVHEVANGAALGEELGIRDVADVVEAALVEAGADLLARADGNGRLHDENRPALQLRQLVDDRPDAREVGVAGIGGRRVDADEQELAVGDIVRRPACTSGVRRSSRAAPERPLRGTARRRRAAPPPSPARRRGRRPRARARRSTRP